MPGPDELIPISEVMEILGLHRTQVKRLLEDGRLAYVTLPAAYRRQGRWRYCRRADVEWLAQDERWRDAPRVKRGSGGTRS